MKYIGVGWSVFRSVEDKVANKRATRREIRAQDAVNVEEDSVGEVALEPREQDGCPRVGAKKGQSSGRAIAL